MIITHFLKLDTDVYNIERVLVSLTATVQSSKSVSVLVDSVCFLKDFEAINSSGTRICKVLPVPKTVNSDTETSPGIIQV